MTAHSDILRELLRLCHETAQRTAGVEATVKSIASEQHEAHESRRELYRMHDENRVGLALVEQSLGRVETVVKDMAPKVEKVVPACEQIIKLQERVDDHEVHVKGIRNIKFQLAAAAVTVGTFVGAVLTLVIEGVRHIGDLKEFLRALTGKG